MKGIIYNLLEEVVSAEHGEDTWDALVDAAGVDGVYTSLGSYADEDLERLVAAASEHLGASPDEVVRWFDRRTMPLFAQRYGALFTAHASTRSFALALNDVIHPEVHKLYPGATTPVFVFDTSSQSTLVMEYRSVGLVGLAQVDVQQEQSGTERVRETSFNLGEGVLNAQIFAVSRCWPGAGAGTPAAAPFVFEPCTQGSDPEASPNCPEAETRRSGIAVEKERIGLAQPSLNLTGWSNPHAAETKALRKACVDEARRNHPR